MLQWHFNLKYLRHIKETQKAIYNELHYEKSHGDDEKTLKDCKQQYPSCL